MKLKYQQDLTAIQPLEAMAFSPTNQETASVLFVGGRTGQWKVEKIAPVTGASLPRVEGVEVIQSPTPRTRAHGAWVLRGVVQPDHYTSEAERVRLKAVQPPLGRLQASRAALIPVKKSDIWWKQSLSRRRELFEERSHHIAMGLEYLPAVARRLYHCRELGEPFDFLTWFEYAPQDARAFEELVRRLRESPEWSFVEREVDIRLSRQA